MIDAKQWCARALAAVSSLWNAQHHHAWRTSQSIAPNDSKYFPTATFHAIAALGECGVWDSNTTYKADKNLLKTPYLEISNFVNYSSYEDVLRTLTTPPQSSPPGAWVKARVEASSHSLEEGRKNTDQSPEFWPRQGLVIGRLFHALRLLVTCAVRDVERLGNHSDPTSKQKAAALTALLNSVRTEMNAASECLYEVVSKKEIVLTAKDAADAAARLSGDLSSNPKVSPYVLLQVAIGLWERQVIWSLLSPGSQKISPDETAERYIVVMRQYFAREIDRLMSQRHIPSSPDYDAASLAFSTHGRILVDPSFREEPLFRACVEAVVADQQVDGSWPDGRSATFDDTGMAIQQPSVAIALSLADCIFRPELLVTGTVDEMQLLKVGLEALRKMGQNLAASFNESTGEHKSSGWVSDRVRWPNVSESWITAMAARLFHVLWLAERACARYERLSKYDVQLPPVAPISDPLSPTAAAKINIVERWQEKVVEPDSFARPKGRLENDVLVPIQTQRQQGAYFLRPRKNGVSFIVFGPPGSGKTFFIKTFAEVLGWPLLTLNPGHFIRKGLELIEATSSEIFSDLMHLDHTVVFFDECDELFRQRSADGNERNILSFATASMLPKLQDLHDAQRVLFFLGTNYLSNVDTAIRREGRFDNTLFFDRPDETARRSFIEKAWESKKGESTFPNELDEAVTKTSGWSIPDVIGYAKAKASNETPAAPSIDDYLNWLSEESEKGSKNQKNELDSSRLNDEEKRGVRNRWQEIKECCKRND